MSDTQFLLRRMQDSLVEALRPLRSVEEVEGFLLLLHPEDKLIWVNQAVPTGTETAEGVTDMLSRYEARGRTPWLEFYRDLWPEVPALLEAQGLVCLKRMPVMVLRADDWGGDQSSIDAQIVGAEAAADLCQVAAEAFGGDPLDGAAIERTAHSLQDGQMQGALAKMDGVPAGFGFTVGSGPIREVAGIGTSPEFRRRGVAMAVIGCLLGAFFAEGGEIAWLTPGDDGAEGLYAKLGFKPIAEQVCYGPAGLTV